MSDELLEKINTLLEERYKFFADNIFSKTHTIMQTIADSEYFWKSTKIDYNRWGFKINGLKFIFILDTEPADIHNKLIWYELEIKYKFRKVLEYCFDTRSNEKNTSLQTFHECEWIGLLDSISDYIKAKNVILYQKKINKKF